jgi:hypothetical protein
LKNFILVQIFVVFSSCDQNGGSRISVDTN